MTVTFSPKLFKVGGLYRAKRSFMSGPDTVFVAGEILAYEDDFHSWYDEAFLYQFHSRTDGQKKYWWMYQADYDEKKPETDWRQFFEPVDPVS